VNVISPKKLIEVALPLDAINVASAREKSIRHGHPSTLHLWWARRPLAAARAVIFSQLVHDPEDLWRCQNPGKEPNQQVKGHWTKARARLFKIIEEMVLWENTTNERVLNEAREEIRKSWKETCELNANHPQAKELFDPKKMPGLHDPFAGGGAIPLEAQRLGFEAFASDLNPVAVLINKATIEIPPKFANKRPVFPGADTPLKNWSGTRGLAEDVRRYGEWMRDEAIKRIGHFYPPIEISKEMTRERPDLKQYEGEKLTVIAWLWARTVKSPNPVFSQVDVPLASSFILSTNDGKAAYIEPQISKTGYRFAVKLGEATAEAKAGTKAARGNFRCLMSNTPIDSDYIRSEASAGRMGQKLMAIVAMGSRGRIYLSPNADHEAIALSVTPKWKPDIEFFQQALGFRIGNYGMTKWSDLFTMRQILALTTFSDLVTEAREKLLDDLRSRGTNALGDSQTSGSDELDLNDDRGIESGGIGPKAYAEAVSVYLAFGVSKLADYCAALVQWSVSRDQAVHVFGRQALPMVWDFCEVCVFAEGAGDYGTSLSGIVRTIESLSIYPQCHSNHANASLQTISASKFISTDPPYYDNIGYADLSDFFYIWLRNALREAFPSLLATITVPKAEELVATPARHGSKLKAQNFFLSGMTSAMESLASQAHPSAPITIYYAFKQSETEGKDDTSSSGWVTFLDAVMRAGLSLTGTWPMRTERPGRMRDTGSNALASSIILVCRPRAKDVGTIDRRKFQRMLNEALPLALDTMTRESEGLHSPVAPVDLSQAIIGPGMAIFSRYDAVLEADGTPMTVKTALQLINRFLAEDDFDGDTQFCLHWFDQHGWEIGKFGEADTLARAKGTSVAGVQSAGVIEAGGGSVRLLKWKEYPSDWDAASDSRLPVWEALHQLIRAYNSDGDSGAAKVLAGVASKAEAARQLAYRLYTLCERAGRAEDARAYNEVVTGWSGIESAAVKVATPQQRTLFDIEETP
jgi:putative DNA methylase